MTNDDSNLRGNGSPREMGTARTEFTTTHWSAVLLAGQANFPPGAAALDYLCRTYWYPLYAYARRRGYGPSDGQDLTQQFFTGFLEKNSIAMATPERGRFRCFLLASFKHFLANEYHRSCTTKHGGKVTYISWDEAEAEGHLRNELLSEVSPEKLFEQSWARTLLEKVMKDLRSEYTEKGKRTLFDAFEVFLSGGKSARSYAAIGASLNLGESAVKMAVSRLRQRYGELLRREIAHTVSGATTVEDELRSLFVAFNG